MDREREMSRVRVLICDDQEVVREGLRAILRSAAQIEVVGAASDGSEALDMVTATSPDVVLMDLKMPVMNGVQAIRELRSRHPEVRVLVLTTFDGDEWVFDAVRSGASGYLLKDSPREQLIEAITVTAAGQTPVDPVVAGKRFAALSPGAGRPETTFAKTLTEREHQVLQLLARGLSNGEIAERVCLAEGTVRNHVSVILSKLQVSDRTQAAVLAIRYGLIDLNE
jgi:DNA-binding NarL/FixJ family response regulator